MKGAIEYLTTLHVICESNNQDCRRCELGKQHSINDTLCPRLSDPRCWDRDKIAKMVKEVRIERK